MGASLCSPLYAALIDSTKLDNQAYLISDSHFYRYSASSGSLVTSFALEQQPIAIATSDSAVFIAYTNKIEKRDLSGAVATDISGGDVTRNLPDIKDIAVSGDSVYVLFFGGEHFHELKTDDLSPQAGVDAPYFTLTKSMQKLEVYSDGGTVFFSPLGKNLGKLDWPQALNGDGEIPVVEFSAGSDAAQYLDIPEKLFVMDSPADPQIIMDNGSGWTMAGEHVVGWIDGKNFNFADQASDGEWSLVRSKRVACESGDALNWGSDLAHYDEDASFVSRSKVGGTSDVYDVVYLWGAGDPSAHLFRESSEGVLDTETLSRSEGLPFDDGKPEYTVAADAPLSDYQLQFGVDAQHVAFNDDKTRAYVLHQGDASCQSAIRVYDLENQSWVDSFPLRWKANAIAMVGGTNTNSSDDQLAIAYPAGYDSYGYTHIVISYVDINAMNPAEDPAKDFLGFNVLHTELSRVQATRYAVLFQVRYDNGTLLSAWNPAGVFSSYFDCDIYPCADPNVIYTWEALAEPGEQAVLVTKSDDQVRLLNLTEDASTFEFADPFEEHDLNDSVKSSPGPILVAPNVEWFTLELDGIAALFRRGSQAMNAGMPSDFLPVSSEIATWSETVQGDAGQYALYTVTGGDTQGQTPAEVQRWVMSLGADDHFEVDSTDSADLPGLPLLAEVIDAATDDLLIATVYQGQVRFTPVNKTLSDAPDFEPTPGGGDSSGGDSGSGGGGSSVSGSGFSSGGGGGGGGSTVWWISCLLLGAGSLRHRSQK